MLKDSLDNKSTLINRKKVLKEITNIKMNMRVSKSIGYFLWIILLNTNLNKFHHCTIERSRSINLLSAIIKILLTNFKISKKKILSQS